MPQKNPKKNQQSKKCSINWDRFKKKLHCLDLKECCAQLVSLLENIEPSEDHVKTFHINQNAKTNCSEEPTFLGTKKMIHKFLFYVYQRNVLASLIKYILLKSTLDLFNSFEIIATKKSLFYLLQQRLEEIVFESVLISFNGSNYDNYLLCHDLLVIVTNAHEKIKIFKKGSSISTINIKCKRNLPQPNSYTIKKNIKPSKNSTREPWLMNLFIKDLRNLLSANMSLDKVGKLFNLKVSKLCFPYEQAISVKRIKSFKSLDPYNETFWKDNFSGKTIDLDTRVKAQELYKEKDFLNLYDYGTYYLVQDCFLLHSILLTMFRTYLMDSINIFIRRNYSQSSLAYQQFFIVEPSKQIEKLVAPTKINHPFYNYLFKQAVTGGLCTSFVHGLVGTNSECCINEHLKYLDQPNLNVSNWPNFDNIKNWKDSFVEKPSGINTIDIRSLYPSASVKKIPVGTPIFFTRVTQQCINHMEQMDEKKVKHWDINFFCKHARENGDANKDFFKRINNPPKGFYEFQALAFYLQNLSKNITILKFQSQFTALGPFYFGIYPVDGFLTFKDQNNIHHIKVIQYNSVYYHGHKETCSISNDSLHLKEKAQKTALVKSKILTVWEHFKNIFNLNDIVFEYVELSDCDFFLHKIPNCKPYIPFLQKLYNYDSFLKNILGKKITGLLVVKNLEIKKNNQNPLFGFVIQKAQYGYDKLSPYTQQQIKSLNTYKRVVSMHKGKSYMVISTEYLVWLYNTFGFESPPDIYHALCFQVDDYLRTCIETKLLARSQIKELIKNETNQEIKQNLEVKAELIKLMLNSSYGYTLCNLTSNKFKQLESRRNLPARNYNKIKSCVKISDKVFLIERHKHSNNNFQTMLGHVGCYILFQSKIILLKRLYFLLKYLNPTKAQLLYMDTDSAHFLLKHKEFIDNVDSNLQSDFNKLFNKHFETGPKISGIWVHEHFFQLAEYLGEKSYRLFNENNLDFLTHMKGLNTNFQTKYHKENICRNQLPIVSYNIFFKTPDFLIFKTHMSKNLFEKYMPIKRYFVSSAGSLPLKL